MPRKIQFSRTGEMVLDAVHPSIYVKGVKLRRHFRNVSKGRKGGSVAVAATPTASSEAKKVEDAPSEFLDIQILLLREITNRELRLKCRFQHTPQKA